MSDLRSGDSTSPSPVVDLFRSSDSTLVLDRGYSLTAPEAADAGEQSGRWLLEQGLVRGDRVALWMRSGQGYIQSFLACAAIGVVVVSVNIRYSTAEVERLLKRAGAKFVITDQSAETLVSTIETIRVEDLLDGIGGSKPSGNPLSPDSSSPGSMHRGGSGEDRCIIFTTSGSTGEPKMVVHRQASIASHSLDIAGHCGFRSEDIALVAMPLCGTFGLSSLLGAVAAGCSKIIVVDRFEASNTASLIVEHQVRLINGSDDLFHRLLRTDADLSSVRIGGYARFNTSLDGIVERAAERGMHLTGLYGMSEVQALFTMRDIEAGPAVRSQAGGTLTSPLADYRIVDGELQLKGPSLFDGYLAEGGAAIDEVLTEAAMDGPWFKTGDSAERSDAGDERSFTFVSRLGDVLRIGGFLVAPSEIEQVLVVGSSATKARPSKARIVGAQVVAVDRPSGARPMAFVLVEPGSGVLDEEEVKRHCAKRLARFKVPIRIIAVTEFPLVDGPNGPKVDRRQLRRMAATLLD